jgi:hypothetical protein
LADDAYGGIGSAGPAKYRPGICAVGSDTGVLPAGTPATDA